MKRNTIQKSVVLETINIMQNHPTADAVYEEVSKMHPSISRATVYRNLNLLAEDGEIGKVDVPDGADRFDHRAFPHYHKKCSSCGKVFDVDLDYMKDLEHTIKSSNGFMFSGHTIMFSGICSECQANMKA